MIRRERSKNYTRLNLAFRLQFFAEASEVLQLYRVEDHKNGVPWAKECGLRLFLNIRYLEKFVIKIKIK